MCEMCNHENQKPIESATGDLIAVWCAVCGSIKEIGKSGWLTPHCHLWQDNNQDKTFYINYDPAPGYPAHYIEKHKHKGS